MSFSVLATVSIAVELVPNAEVIPVVPPRATRMCSSLSNIDPLLFAITLEELKALLLLFAPEIPNTEVALSVTFEPSVPKAVTIFGVPSSSSPEPVPTFVILSAFSIADKRSIIAPSLFPVIDIMSA